MKSLYLQNILFLTYVHYQSARTANGYQLSYDVHDVQSIRKPIQCALDVTKAKIHEYEELEPLEAERFISQITLLKGIEWYTSDIEQEVLILLPVEYLRHGGQHFFKIQLLYNKIQI